jgi:hypothetical protein
VELMDEVNFSLYGKIISLPLLLIVVGGYVFYFNKYKTGGAE